MRKNLLKAFSAITILALMLMALPMQSALADSTPQSLPFSQNWTNTGLITTNDDWSAVPGIVGFLGQDITTGTGADPQTLLTVSSFANDVDVIANQTNPNTLGTGGVAEFHITDPAIALNGSGTADAPHIILYLNTVGQSNVTVTYNLRDLDSSADNAIQAVAVQYRIGSSGNFTNIPAGFVADATTGGTATQVTPVSVALPSAVNNQPEVQVRIITSNAVGNDEWVGVDDINVTGTSVDPAPFVADTIPADLAANVVVDSNIEVTFSEPVDVVGDWFQIVCETSGTRNVADTAVTGGPTTFTIDPNADFDSGETCTVTVFASQVTDQDTNEPDDNMASNYSWSFDTVGAPGPSVFFNEIHYDNNSGDVGEAIEIAGPTCTDLTGWSVVLYNGNGGAPYNTRTLSGPIPNVGGGFGVVVLNYPTDGIQNGSPDGMALVDDENNVIQFLSYEGSFTAVGGPANGMVSVDIGVSEATTTPVGQSLQLTGSGSTYNNFTWAAAATNTFGAFNNSQTFTGGGTTNPCGIGAATPSTVFAGDTTLLTVNVISGTNPASTGLAVTADLTAIGGSASQTFYDDGSNGDVTASDNIFSYSATVPGATSPGVYALPATVTDAESRSGSASISLTVQPPFTAIHTIQGASHISPLNGQLVTTQGIVTVKGSNGFYLQDLLPDSDDATSEAIFVFTSSAPTSVNVGDAVSVSGTVTEFRPGNAPTNLTTTEISSPSITVNSTGNPLPAATVIGNGGRVQPTTVIEDDATGDVETSGVFDPATDGIDFYESMEAMLVQVNNPVAVGPRNGFGEIFVLPDDGANASVRTTRGGIVIRPNDFNPERIQLDDNFATTPLANVGDHFSGPAVGVLDYNFGNFEILITSALTAVSGGLTRESTVPADPNELAIATFNVENLTPGDGPAKFNELASLITNNLQAPDIIAIEEVQDNNGAPGSGQCPAVADGIVDASQTWGTLIAAIETASGITYDYRQIDPVDCADGGAPGGNIRVGFLFRTDRGLAFVDRPGGGSTTATTIVNNGGIPELSSSPGRIDPTNPAFNASRKPLAGEFTFNGATLFVIVNHFNSKGGDQPLFGRFQPPALVTETQRIQQAQIVNTFVDNILAVDPDANIVVAGDLNDFEFSTAVNTVEGGVLHTLMETLPQNERYSYVFEGNSQSLDHLLISDHLFNNTPFEYDVVHVNAEFAVQASDHDPQVVRLAVDGIEPAVTIDQASGQADPTGVSPINFTVVFSEPVTGFDGSDVSLGGSAGATAAVVTEVAPNDGTTYNVAVSGMTANGTVTASIPAGAATDAAGNGNTASTSTDNTVTYNNTAPTIAVAAGGMCSASGGTMNLTVSDAEGDTMTLSGSSSNTSAVPNANIVFGGSGSNRTVAITAVPASTVRTATLTITVSDGISTSSTTITVVVGTNGNNTALNGTSDADLILGLDGNDTLNGLGGNDLLCGGAKNDTLNGGDNNDTLKGEAGNDILTGGTGADSFSGGPGNDANTDFNAGQGDTSDGT